MNETYMIFSQVHYDSVKGCYLRILTMDRKPQGPLANWVRILHSSKLSPFQESSPCCTSEHCIFAMYSQDTGHLLQLCSQPLLLTFMLQNGYTIDSELTKIMQNNRVKSSNKKQLMFVIHYTPTPNADA